MKTLPSVNVVIPHENVNDEMILVTHWHADEGQIVEAGAPLVDIETSKANITLESPATGPVHRIGVAGKEFPVGGIVAVIGGVITTAESASSPDSLTDARGPVFSRAAAVAIRAAGLEPTSFADRDFVRTADLEPRKEPASSGAFRRATPTKRTEAAALARVAGAVVPSALFRRIDVARVIDPVNAHLRVLRGSLLPIVVFETARLLHEYPLLNAAYQPGGAFLYEAVVIGIALDLGKGLRVATLAPEATTSIRAVESGLLDLVDLYESDKIPPDRLTGATFTITDLSNLGIDFFVPVLNENNSAILGIGCVDHQGSQTLSLAFDHRVTEGREAGSFMRDLGERIESYAAVATTSRVEQVCSRCGRTAAEDIDLDGLGLFPATAADGESCLICSLCIRGF